MKVIKYIIGLFIPAALCLLCAYLIQYPFYKFDAREASVAQAILLLALSGVAVVLVYGGTALLNKRFEWLSGNEMAAVIAFSALTFVLIMWNAFEKIPIPYSWIPSNSEMAFDFGQFLIQVFTIVPAFIIAGICKIYLIRKKVKRQKASQR